MPHGACCHAQCSIPAILISSPASRLRPKPPPLVGGGGMCSKQPCNAELPLTLMDSWITPTDLFFVRHHHPVPAVDAASFRLLVSAPGVPPTSFSLLELQSKFKHHTVAATLQCGGNRRGGMSKRGPSFGFFHSLARSFRILRSLSVSNAVGSAGGLFGSPAYYPPRAGRRWLQIPVFNRVGTPTPTARS
jgi:hypothetical protein